MPAADDAGNVMSRWTAAQEALKRHFLGWQCRIRQHVMRDGGGRPSPGMCPTVGLGMTAARRWPKSRS